MRKLLVLAAMVALVAGFTTVSHADTSSEAVASVYAVVNPNVALVPNTPTVDAGTVQTGDFEAMIDFRVDANMEEVSFYVEASPLYKGDDPLNQEVAPIPLNMSEGVMISPTNANPVMSGSNVAAYVGDGVNIGDFPTQLTETIAFESSQNNRFSQDVSVKVTYTQDDDEKPMGEYSGKVRLTALLTP